MEEATVVLCVGVVRGRRFPKTSNEHALIVETSFHKIAQSSPPVIASVFPVFNAEFRWEMTNKQLKDFKSKREPIKVNITEVGGGGGTHVGTHVVYMRDVQGQECKSWVPLLHAKPSLRPEIEVSHRIVDKSILMNPPSNNPIKKPIKKPPKPKNPVLKPPKQEEHQEKNNKPKNPNPPKAPKPPRSEYESDFESETGSDLDLGSELGSDFDSETENTKKPETTKPAKPNLQKSSPSSSSSSPSPSRSHSHSHSHSPSPSLSPSRSTPPSPPTPPQPPKGEVGYFQEDPDLNDRSLDIAFHEYQDKQGVSSQKERLRINEASHFVHEIVNPSSPSPKGASKPTSLPNPSTQPPIFPEVQKNFNKININDNNNAKQEDYTQRATTTNNKQNNYTNNKNPGGGFGGNNPPIYEDIDVARDSPEYAAALMLAKWRDKEKDQFYKNLKVKESALMDKLKSYWMERERQIKSTMLQRDKEISSIASHIQQALTRVQEKEEFAIKKEEQVHSMRENLQKLYNSKMVEVQIVCQRLMDDHAARLELEKVKMHELETGEKILRDRLASIERRLHIADDEFLEARRKTDNVPVAKLQTEITQNKQHINDMYQELQQYEKETNDNKENLLKIYKEIARVKREYTEEIEKQMKKEQQELSELRKQFQPTHAFT